MDATIVPEKYKAKFDVSSEGSSLGSYKMLNFALYSSGSSIPTNDGLQ
jgi:hypothetical protein